MPTIEGSIGLIANAGAPGAGTAEVQTLTVGGTPTGGTFRLKMGPFLTGAITWSSTDATLVARIDSALELLPQIGTGGMTVADVSLTNGIGDASLTFVAVGPKDAIALAANNLTGAAPTISIAETTPGVAATGVGHAKGGILTDTTNGILYINTGTPTVPTWIKVGTQT